MELLNIEKFSHLVVSSRPYSQATVRGNDKHPEITGTVRFYNANPGVLVLAEVFNLPQSEPGQEGQVFGPFYGFHLHEGNECGNGAGDDPFKESKGHYNPTNQPHPYHAGDFPPLLGNHGYAYGSFYSARLTPNETIGRTVIVHQNADDFHTQPSGNSGEKIACGVVMPGIQPL